MKKLLVAVTFALVVQGCLPVVFVAGAATGAIVYDHRTTKTIVNDRDVTFQIQNRLNNDPEFKDQSHLSVTAFNHIVLLVGQVTSDDLRKKAEDIARSNSKVRMVYNEITVEKPIGDLARTNDTWITTKVKTVLAATSGLNSASLKILTENKVVYLLGLTTKEQAKLAADKARTVSGVVKVVKLFEYMG